MGPMIDWSTLEKTNFLMTVGSMDGTAAWKLSVTKSYCATGGHNR
jgi:hypothetical protein